MNRTTSRVLRAIQRQPLETLVENRSVFGAHWAELNIYQTLRQAEKISLRFPAPILASMIEGKKIMQLEKRPSFAFLPGESVILPPEQEVMIDFPEATEEQPTRCLALAISPEAIHHTLDQLNERFPRLEPTDQWQIDENDYHLAHDRGISYTIDRLIFYFTEDHPDKDVFIEHALQELLIRLMQTQTRHLLIDKSESLAHSHRIAFAVQYIREHLHEDISIEDLCRKACLSRPHFFRCFKNELGLTPTDFINRSRIERAQHLLRQPQRSITDACYAVGFNSLSYFNRVFRKVTGLSPQQYQKQIQGSEQSQADDSSQ
jgi:AraC family transcriptional regulator